jgi:hypothetical protein
MILVAGIVIEGLLAVSWRAGYYRMAPCWRRLQLEVPPWSVRSWTEESLDGAVNGGFLWARILFRPLAGGGIAYRESLALGFRMHSGLFGLIVQDEASGTVTVRAKICASLLAGLVLLPVEMVAEGLAPLAFVHCLGVIAFVAVQASRLERLRESLRGAAAPSPGIRED